MKRINVNQPYAVYETLKNLFAKYQINYREIEHIPEGRSEEAAKVRGSEWKQGAKAIVLDALVEEEQSSKRKYFLAVLPGPNKINLEVVKGLTGAKKISFAKTDFLKELTGCERGEIPPFSFNDELNIIFDPELLKNKEITFNAGRLDRSIFISSDDYRKILKNEYQERAVECAISKIEEKSTSMETVSAAIKKDT